MAPQPAAGAPQQAAAPDPLLALQAQLTAIEKQVTWEDVKTLLSQDAQRLFRIDIETDSTIAGDVQAEQAGMAQLLQGIAQFVTSFGPAVQMGFIPVDAAKAMLMAAVRRFKMGKTVEDAIDAIPEGPQAQQAIQGGGKGKGGQDQSKLAQQAMIEDTKRQQIQADAAQNQQELSLRAQEAAEESRQTEQELGLRAREVALAEQKLAIETAQEQTRMHAENAQRHAEAVTSAMDRMGDLVDKITRLHQQMNGQPQSTQ